MFGYVTNDDASLLLKFYNTSCNHITFSVDTKA